MHISELSIVSKTSCNAGELVKCKAGHQRLEKSNNKYLK